MRKNVAFDSKTKPNAGAKPGGRAGGDTYEDDFEVGPGKGSSGNKGAAQPKTFAGMTSAANGKGTSSAKSGISQGSVAGGPGESKKVANYEDVEATNQTNRYIIYKFMKKGFTSLSAEDLACTMVNPDFSVDFRKNTGEEWASTYQFKVVERLDNCKYNLQWVTKKAGNS